MIEEFSFGNFRSFKDIQTLNMTAAKIKSSNPDLDIDNLIPINDKLSLLKSKAIYGANASGKSNVIKAIGCFIKIINESSVNENILGLVDAFELSSETENEPSFFQIIFRDEKNTRYRYGFECNSEEIKSEWLFATPNLREKTLFVRENQKVNNIDSTHFSEGLKYIKLIGDRDNGSNDNNVYTRPNALFLKSIALTGFGKLSKTLVDIISTIAVIDGLGNQGMHNIAANQLNTAETKKYLVDFLKYADIGIDDLSVVEIEAKDYPKDNLEIYPEKQKLVVARRKKFSAVLNADSSFHLFPFYEESEGTQKMFELSPYIKNALENGTPIIIDEFDARFHPLITKKIIELFNSHSNKNAQFIFVTHDTNLLSSELLRKDQIEFVEKDKYGASHLYSLLQFKGIRNNASFEKDYIQGKYGAVPFLGNFNFNKLFKLEDNA